MSDACCSSVKGMEQAFADATGIALDEPVQVWSHVRWPQKHRVGLWHLLLYLARFLLLLGAQR